MKRMLALRKHQIGLFVLANEAVHLPKMNIEPSSVSKQNLFAEEVEDENKLEKLKLILVCNADLIISPKVMVQYRQSSNVQPDFHFVVESKHFTNVHELLGFPIGITRTENTERPRKEINHHDYAERHENRNYDQCSQLHRFLPFLIIATKWQVYHGNGIKAKKEQISKLSVDESHRKRAPVGLFEIMPMRMQQPDEQQDEGEGETRIVKRCYDDAIR